MATDQLPTEYLWMRGASILVVLFAIYSYSSENIYVIGNAILFAHVVLATFSSRRPLGMLLGEKWGWLRLSLLALLFYWIAFVSPSDRLLATLLSLHIAFSDVFLLPNPHARFPRTAVFFRVLFNVSVYFFCLAWQVLPFFHRDALSTAGVGMLFALTAYFNRNVPRIIAFEAAFLLLAIVSVLHRPFSLMEAVLYHFIMWVFLPIWRLHRSERTGAATAMLSAQAALVACFLFFMHAPWFAAYDVNTWSYFHLAFSFGLSSANPRWLLGPLNPRLLALARAG